MWWDLGRMAAALVVRSKDVQLLAMRGSKVAARVRVPLDGAEERDLIRAIQQAVAASGLKTKRFAVSIQSQDILVRFFTIPQVPKAELDSTVQFEARKYLPFKPDQLVWDYHAMPSAVPNRLEVVFAAIPRDQFRRLQEVFKSAGVQPAWIESSGLSLARLLEPGRGRPFANDFVCVVDVEQDTAHLAIVKGGVPYLMRDIALSVPSEPNPAEERPREEPQAPGAIAEPSGGVEAEEPDVRVRRLFSELSVSMDFFTREYPSTAISRVLLFGEEALVAPWRGWLSEQLRCSVELGASLVDRRVKGGLPLVFASALGLLQAGKDRRAAALDFLKRSASKPSSAPQAVSPKRAQLQWTEALKTPQAAKGIAAVAAVVLVVTWTASRFLVKAESAQLERVVQSEPDAGWGLKGKPQRALDLLKEQASAQLGLLQRVIGHRVRVAEKLDALARSLPDGVWLIRFVFEDPLDFTGNSEPRLSVNGACYLGEAGKELSAIQAFGEQLKRNQAFFNGFQTAQLDQINSVNATAQAQYTYRIFQLNCAAGRRL